MFKGDIADFYRLVSKRGAFRLSNQTGNPNGLFYINSIDRRKNVYKIIYIMSDAFEQAWIFGSERAL